MAPTGWRVYVTAMWALTTRLMREQWCPGGRGLRGLEPPGEYLSHVPGRFCSAEVDSGTVGFSRGEWPRHCGEGTLGIGLGSGLGHRDQQASIGTDNYWPACPHRATAHPGRRVGQLGTVTRIHGFS